MQRICVFSGSSAGARPSYVAAARALGSTIARRGLGLVYGGAAVGLMGVVADAALAGGGEVIGVIPQGLVDREIAHHGLTDLQVTTSLHERKARMGELSDAFVALPGGLGTLDEVAEVLTWSQLGLYAKPCGLLDVAGFWQPLLAFLDHAVAEEFVHAEHRSLVCTGEEAGELLDLLDAWRPPSVDKLARVAPVAGDGAADPREARVGDGP